MTLLYLTGVGTYDTKLNEQWAVLVREIHGRIEDNFDKIQAVMNLLIGLVIIAVGLLIQLVLGLLIEVIRMAR